MCVRVEGGGGGRERGGGAKEYNEIRSFQLPLLTETENVSGERSAR